VLLFHGGPNGSHFASWSPIAESLQLAGWRVVRPNIRGSAVRDSGLRPGLPDTYGVEDLADAVTVLDAFADDRMVAGGTSYGGYLAGRVAAVTGRVSGVFMIGGFLRFTDLRASEHPFTRAFLRSPRVRETLDDRPDPGQRYLIIHGERDERTPLTALTRNLPVLPHAEVVELPGEGHGLTTDAAARTAIPALFEWLDRC
jgi:pimeloyl-ACP methyl ester carboxylesterase